MKSRVREGRNINHSDVRAYLTRGDPIMDDPRDRLVSINQERSLCIRVVGDPDGFPVVVLGGIPGASRIDVESFHEAGQRHGLQMIGVDRPGVGRSDRHPWGTMNGWSEDFARLVDALELDRVAIVTMSGGVAYGLAAAHALSDRVVHLCLVAPAWLVDDAATRGMPGFNRFLWWCARHLPSVFRFMVGRLMVPAMSDPDRSIAAAFPEVDQAVLHAHPEIERRMKAGLVEAIRPGTEGMIQDALVAISPLPFDVSTIHAPTTVWHGTADANAPIRLGQQLVDQLPQARAEFLDGEGHISILVHHMDAMAQEIKGRAEAAHLPNR